MSKTAIQCGDLCATLGSTPINNSWIRRGNPSARSATLFGIFNRTDCTVVWECSPGEFDWHYHANETILILDGVVLLDDGVTPPRRVGAGDVVLFPAGAVVHWTVESHVRKLAFFARPSASPLALGRRVLRKGLSLIRGRSRPSQVPSGGRHFAPGVDAGLA